MELISQGQPGVQVESAIVNIIHSPPDTFVERIGEEDGYIPIKKIHVSTATDEQTIIQNVKTNIEFRRPYLKTHPEFQKIKGKDQPIAIVGGGPSLKKTWSILDYFEGPIMAAGSSYDFLRKLDIVPKYFTACDPDKAVLNYLKYPTNVTDYLISTYCDPEVFRYLKDKRVYTWHVYSENTIEHIKQHDSGSDLIGGGCTIGLRSINLALLLGYTNIHLFGFDSCIESLDETHAYDIETPEEKLALSDAYKIKIGKNGKKQYLVLGYQLAQAEHFKEWLTTHYRLITFTFHGEGLLKDVYEDFLSSNKETV